jgi:hypothetical protein
MQNRVARAAVGLVLAAAVGSCSGTDEVATRAGSGGASSGSGGSSSGVGGSGGIIGGGGVSGGTGGTGTTTPDAACQAVSAQADNKAQPADIVFAIDNSGSMDEEAIWVQQQMNAFSQQIVAAKIDVHVVLISAYPGGEDNGVCIDPPLGSGGCPTRDTNLPAFLHVNEEVSSHDALELLVSKYPQYRTSLRASATKHFVVVTDDESEVPAATFSRDLVALDPTSLTGFKFHGIFSFTEGNNDHCDGFSAGEGKVYKELVAQTGGVSGDLCLQDFKPVFDRLARAVVGGSKLACEWEIPPPPAGKTFTPSQTNVTYGAVGQPGRQIPYVDSAAACANAKDGWAWFYDDNLRPTKITVCPQACTAIQGNATAKIDIYFGCPTVIVPK